MTHLSNLGRRPYYPMSFAGKWYGFGQDPGFDEGVRAYEAGEYASACALFRDLIKRPANEDLKAQARSFLVGALHAIAKGHLSDGRPIEARESFREAIGIQPRYADLWLGLAIAAGRLGDEATERGAVGKAREINPRYARAILYEALMALKAGESDRATTILATLPSDTVPAGPDDLLIDALQAIFAAEGTEVQELIQQGDQALKDGQPDIAAALYRQAAQQAPKYADVRCKLAQTLLELDHLSEAESHLNEALEINPDYAEAWAQLGIALKRQGRRAEAKQAFTRAYELDKHHPIAKLEMKRIF